MPDRELVQSWHTMCTRLTDEIAAGASGALVLINVTVSRGLTESVEAKLIRDLMWFKRISLEVAVRVVCPEIKRVDIDRYNKYQLVSALIEKEKEQQKNIERYGKAGRGGK